MADQSEFVAAGDIIPDVNEEAVDLSSRPASFSPISPIANCSRSADSSPRRSGSELQKTASPRKSPENELPRRIGRPRKTAKQTGSTIPIFSPRHTRSVANMLAVKVENERKQRFDFRPRILDRPAIVEAPQVITDNCISHQKKKVVADSEPQPAAAKPEALTKKPNEQQPSVEKRARKRALSPKVEPTNVLGNSSTDSRAIGMQKVFKELRESIIGQGIWIQCSACMKWRHLPPGSDPSQQPAPWYCSMNKDDCYNNCSVEPEKNEEADTDLIAAEFSLGSIVWAKTPGFPWWPAMVDLDPDNYEFYWLEENTNRLSHYNVTYFDEKVSRAWVTTNHIRRFTEEISGKEMALVGKHQYYAKQREVAIQEAKAASLLTVEERAEKFGFIAHVCKDSSSSTSAILNKLNSAAVSPVPSQDSGVASPVSRASSAAANSTTSEQPKRRKLDKTVNVKRGTKQTKPAEDNVKEEDEEEALAPPKPMSLSDWLMNGPRPSAHYF